MHTTIPEHLRGIKLLGSARRLPEAPLVAITSVRFVDSTGYEGARFAASLAASRAFREAGVPQIVMVDPASHAGVAPAFLDRDSIVVSTPRSGLARPYLDAAQIVLHYAGPEAGALKAEPDKRFTSEGLQEIARLLGDGCDVVVGDRTSASMQSMSPAQQATEAVLDAVIQKLLGIPHGVTSGVQAYGPLGLGVFLGYERLLKKYGDNWLYLLTTPLIAAEQEFMHVTSTPVEIIYDRGMVDAENTPALTLKRLEQMLIMLEGALRAADDLLPSKPSYTKPEPDRRQMADVMLATLRELVAAS
jgi:hypothetical protein